MRAWGVVGHAPLKTLCMVRGGQTLSPTSLLRKSSQHILGCDREHIPCQPSSAPFFSNNINTSIPQCLKCASREDHHRTPKHRLRPSFRPCVHHGMQAGSETIIGSGIREDHHWTPGPWKYHLRTSMPVVSCQARGCRMCACMHLRFMVLQTLAQTD